MNRGFDLIQNHDLRSRIMDIYDFEYQIINEIQEGIFIKNEVLVNYCIDHFDQIDIIIEPKMIPLGYELLRKDKKYKTLLKSRKKEFFLQAFWNRRAHRKLEILITDVQKEIEKLKK